MKHRNILTGRRQILFRIPSVCIIWREINGHRSGDIVLYENKPLPGGR